MDSLSRKQRSERMALVRSKDTKPELVVRKLVFALGYRYRLHARDLPGRPDLVFKNRQRVVFVHGCFWHRHKGCGLARLPKSRLDFWLPKLQRNSERDKLNERALKSLGWKVLVVWECELKNAAHIASKVRRFLDAER